MQRRSFVAGLAAAGVLPAAPPPRQRPASFSIDQVIDKLNASMKSAP